MNTNELTAQSLFNEYLFSRQHEMRDLTGDSHVENMNELKRTHFRDVDTILYSKLIEKALNLNPEVKTIIDFGAGSSIPTLLAIKNSGRTDVRTIAVDIDEEAKRVGSENARALGLENNFVFFKGRMEDVINELGPYGPETLIVSNPPYIASPATLKDRYFIPVNGGFYGDEFLLKILNYPFKKGVNLAILWGSLTSPREVVPLMQKKFETLHTTIYRAGFGDYTKTEPLRSHLYQLRKKGLVYFEDDNRKNEIQFVFGNILRA